MAYECVLFDMDGTLVDSVEFHAHSFVRFFELYHQPRSYQQVRPIITGSFSEIFQALDIPPELEAPLYGKLPGLYAQVDDLIEQHVRFNGDVPAALQALRQKGIPMGMISNSKHELVVRMAQVLGIDRYFRILSGAGDDNQNVDKLSRCEAAARQLGVCGSQVLYVGDGERDVEVANALGFDSCLLLTPISWAASVDHILNTLRPTHVIKDITALPALV